MTMYSLYKKFGNLFLVDHILVICDQIISCPIPLESTADYVGGSQVKCAKYTIICAQQNNRLSIRNKE